MLARLPLDPGTWAAMVESVDPGDWGERATSWAGTRRVSAVVLPDACSRHNSPSRAWAIPGQVQPLLTRSGTTAILLAVTDASHALASALAVARALPIYDRRTRGEGERRVLLAALGPHGPVADQRIGPAIDAVRQACRLFDTPTNELHTDAFVDEARAVAQRTGAELTVLRGQALEELGMGGLLGVGKAARHGPALVALLHDPPGAERTVAWVGKGLVYDTGGLSLKSKDGMPGMKGDMGGAAAVLAAFEAAVRTGFPERLVAVLCLAENAIGPDATRPDDILTLHSGRTVEVNNTDAEGRLVLADGVTWVCRRHQPDLVVDLATLTGAALVATGKVHAAILSNDADLEAAAVAAGLRAGEPCHPLPWAPELFRKELRSHVADMKNSVKDRMNAQSSCAGQFIANHLPDPAPPWLHVDLAGPAFGENDRGTGFGVGLLLELGAGPARYGG